MRIPFALGTPARRYHCLARFGSRKNSCACASAVRFEVPSQIHTARPGALTDTPEVHRILPIFSTLRHRYRYTAPCGAAQGHHTRAIQGPRTRTPTQGLRTNLCTKSPVQAHTRPVQGFFRKHTVLNSRSLWELVDRKEARDTLRHWSLLGSLAGNMALLAGCWLCWLNGCFMG